MAAEQGQQVYISYGAQSNDRLLQFYGCVEADNPADVYVLTNFQQQLQVALRDHSICCLMQKLIALASVLSHGSAVSKARGQHLVLSRQACKCRISWMLKTSGAGWRL